MHMRDALRRLARNHPALTGVAVMVIWQLTVYGLGAAPALAWQPDWFPGLGATTVNVVGAVVVLGIGAALGVLPTSGIFTVGVLRRWVWILPLVLINLFYLVPGIVGDARTLVSGAVVMLAVGVSEEVAGRGVALTLARPIGDHAAAWLIGAVFGIGHLGNAILFDAPLDDTLWQVVTTTALGFCYGMLRLHIGSIWPLVLVHASDDWMQIYSPGAAPLWFQIVHTIAAVALGYLCFAVMVRTRRHAGLNQKLRGQNVG